MKLLWFSAGATSAVACKIAINRYGKENVRVIYFKIDSAHPDNDRFIKECEEWYGVPIEQVSSHKYTDQFDVIKNTKYVNGVQGARCTSELKRAVRTRLEKEIEFDGQVFGFEFTPKEIERAERLVKNHPHTLPIFPLIENRVGKEECLHILKKQGIEIPTMYKLGYPNNNCIGCVKGGAGYWNKIRVDFPEEFKKMAELERDVGRSCLKDKDGNRLYLDELAKDYGRELKMIIPDCGFFCGDIGEYI